MLQVKYLIIACEYESTIGRSALAWKTLAALVQAHCFVYSVSHANSDKVGHTWALWLVCLTNCMWLRKIQWTLLVFVSDQTVFLMTEPVQSRVALFVYFPAIYRRVDGSDPKVLMLMSYLWYFLNKITNCRVADCLTGSSDFVITIKLNNSLRWITRKPRRWRAQRTAWSGVNCMTPWSSTTRTQMAASILWVLAASGWGSVKTHTSNVCR